MSLEKRKKNIEDLIRVFYKSNFKVFYVNSINADTFVRPIGLFISFGMTVSMDTINSIKTIISDCSENAEVVEIECRKKNNQYLNTIISHAPVQYLAEELKDVDNVILSKEEAEEELKSLSKQNSSKIQKLQDAITRLEDDSSWDNFFISKQENDYKIYHKYLNYKKTKEVEYRIGIFVEIQS